MTTTRVLLDIAADAAVSALALGIYLFCIRPQLVMRRARWGAFLIPAAAAIAMPFAVALGRLGVLAVIAVPLLLLVLLVVWLTSAPLVRVTGGPRPLPDDVQEVISSLAGTWDLFEVGDLDAAREEVSRLGTSRTPATSRYMDLWQQFFDEEVARRAGSRESSRDTMRQISEEAARLTMPSRRVPTWLVSLVLALSAVIASAPAVVYARACISVAFLLPSQPNSGAEKPSPLANSLLASPEPNAQLPYDQAMDIGVAVESLHDPDTRAQLEADGFSAGYARQWLAADGRQIEAAVFEFRNSEGALSYHRSVNEYACQFSNEAFRGPGGGVGLQVRWSRGDPIVEQVSWVMGTRRFVVSVSALTPPGGHDRVLRLAQQQLGQAVH